MTVEAPPELDDLEALAVVDGVIPNHCPDHTNIVTAAELGYGPPTYTHTSPKLVGGRTVQDDFYSWTNGARRGQGCAPIVQTWTNHLLSTWGGENWGCVDDRYISGTSLWSTHASGAAIDWGYGPAGRSVVDLQVLPLFINNSEELGVQAVHDYLRQRIWRPPSYRGCSTVECGWKAQSMDSGYWLHIECTYERWGDTRPFDDIDGEPGDPNNPSKPAIPAEPGMLDCLFQEEQARRAALGLPSTA